MRRCFRYEFVIKTLIIFGIFILDILYFAFIYYKLPFLSIFVLLSFPILIIYSMRLTLQRYHDLGLSGWYVLFFSYIPIVNSIVSFFLFFKKGNCRINEYDEPINYNKLFKNRHCINIHDKILIVDNEEYQYERYLGKYTIKISNYVENNFFTEYLLKKYPSNEEQKYNRTNRISYKAIEITEEEFSNLIKQMNLIIIINSFYVKINKFDVFIRKEDFKYTIILDKKINNISKDLLDIVNFPGLFFEDKEYIYYKKINKNDLLMWVKNVA